MNREELTDDAYQCLDKALRRADSDYGKISASALAEMPDDQRREVIAEVVDMILEADEVPNTGDEEDF